MAYPAVDSDTLAAYELDEATLVFAGEAATSGLNLDTYAGPFNHVPEHYGSWSAFRESVANVSNGYLYETLPASATTKTWEVGLPALFKPTPRGFGFFQGTASQQRDYIVLGGGPTSLMKTMSLWVQPFNFLATQELVHKEFFDCTPNDGVRNGAWAAPFYGGFQFFIGGSAGAWGASVNVGGTVSTLTIQAATEEHVFLRANVWNHIGCTYDGATFRAYCNGQLAKSVGVVGSITYGAGPWVMGALRDGGGPGAISQANAIVKRLRWEKVTKPLSYFFDCYTSAAAGGGGPPQVSFG